MKNMSAANYKWAVAMFVFIFSIDTHAASLAPLLVNKTELYQSIAKAYAKDGVDINSDGSSVVSRGQYKYKDANFQFNLILNIEHNYVQSGEIVSSCSVMLMDHSYQYLSRSTLQLPSIASNADDEKTDCRNFEAVSIGSSSLPSFIIIISYGPNQFGSPEVHAPQPKRYSAIVIDVVQKPDGKITVRSNTSCFAATNNIRTISAAKLRLRQCEHN